MQLCVCVHDRLPRLLESTSLHLSDISTPLRDLVRCFRYLLSSDHLCIAGIFIHHLNSDLLVAWHCI